LWPTRKGEAIAEGSPPPRGGDRREPNPLFLAHAAAISELYVGLSTALPDGVHLAGFEREAEAREAFRGFDGKEHAVAPDAAIQIAEPDGRVLLALVELDLGTMSTRQLKAKAEGYGEYVQLDGWRERRDFCPPLLFITTSEKRARSFLALCDRAVDRRQMIVAATSLAREIGRSLVEPEWLFKEGETSADLLAILRGARRPYDQAQEREEVERREEEAEREQLRSDPTALREHLRSWRHRGWGVERFGSVFATALEITIERDEELDEAERQALTALGALFVDPLRLELAERDPTAEERRSLDRLADYNRARQVEHVGELAARFCEGPALREVRGRLEGGELLTAADASWGLSQKAADDERSRAEQERLRRDYLQRREDRARRRAKAQRIVARLRHGPGDFLEEIDREALRVCRACREIAYPDPERARYEGGTRDVAFRCHFCGSRNLEGREPEVDGGEVEQ